MSQFFPVGKAGGNANGYKVGDTINGQSLALLHDKGLNTIWSYSGNSDDTYIADFALDSSGNVFIAFGGSNRICKILQSNQLEAWNYNVANVSMIRIDGNGDVVAAVGSQSTVPRGLIKISGKDGTLVWGSLNSNTSSAYATSICLDSSNDVYEAIGFPSDGKTYYQLFKYSGETKKSLWGITGVSLTDFGIVVADNNGYVYCAYFNYIAKYSSTGSLLQTYALKDKSIRLSLAGQSDLLRVSNYGRISRVALNDMSTVWEVPVRPDGTIPSNSVLIANDKQDIYHISWSSSTDGILRKLRFSDGETIWSYPITGGVIRSIATDEIYISGNNDCKKMKYFDDSAYKITH